MQKGENTKDFSAVSPVQVHTMETALHPYSPFFSKKVGFILLAGGQGSRLGCECPKGMVSIPPSDKTLFEIFLRRMVGFFRTYHTWPSCGIMTSDETDRETRKYLKEQNFFGVPEEYVSFFCQASLPLLDSTGEPILENGEFVQGPDGNGKVFHAFLESGLYHTWKERGIVAVEILPIDNPLMDPFLPSLFQPVIEGQSEAAFATLKRRSPQERVGVFLLQNDKLSVVEYSEIPDEIRNAQTTGGTLLHAWANISVMCLSMETIDRVHDKELPLHFAKKMRGSQPIFKAEYFIFDTFPFIPSFSLIGLDRERYFSPIKAKTGEDSLEQASMAFERLQRGQMNRVGWELGEGHNASSLDPADLYIGN